MVWVGASRMAFIDHSKAGLAWSSPPPPARARLRNTSMWRASSIIWVTRKFFTSKKSWGIL